MEDTAKNECIVKDYIGETQSLEQEVKDAESDEQGYIRPVEQS